MPLFNLAYLYVEHDEFAKAEPIIDRVFHIEEVSGVESTLDVKYLLRAIIRKELGRQQEAIEDMQKHLDIAEQTRASSSGTEQERAEFFASFGLGYEQMIDWQREAGNDAAAFAAAERSRSRTLVDQMAAARVDLLQGLPAEDARQLTDAESQAAARVRQIETQLYRVAAQNLFARR